MGSSALSQLCIDRLGFGIFGTFTAALDAETTRPAKLRSFGDEIEDSSHVSKHLRRACVDAVSVGLGGEKPHHDGVVEMQKQEVGDAGAIFEGKKKPGPNMFRQRRVSSVVWGPTGAYRLRDAIRFCRVSICKTTVRFRRFCGPHTVALAPCIENRITAVYAGVDSGEGDW